MIVHHPGHAPHEALDWYDDFFEEPTVGTWVWRPGETEADRAMLLIVPIVGRPPAENNRMEKGGGELLRVFVNRQPDNWNARGDVSGWDGNISEPTLHPSIFVRGRTKNPGWHGFFERGKLRNA